MSFWLSLKEAQHLTSLYYCVNTRDTYTQCRASRSEFLRLSISIPVAIIMRIVFKWLSWSKFPFLQCSIHITCVRLSPRVEKLEFFHACAMVNMRARTHVPHTDIHSDARVRSQASITPRLVNPLGEKTLIKLAGITETAAHMQEACSNSGPSYTRRRLDLAICYTGARARTFARSARNKLHS